MKVDISNKAITQPGIHISFQMEGKQDVEELAYLFGLPLLTWDRNVRPMDRPDGFDWLLVPEHGRSQGGSHAVTQGTAQMRGTAQSHANSECAARTQSLGMTQSRSESQSSQRTTGTQDGVNGSNSQSFGSNHSQTDNTTESEGSNYNLRSRHDVWTANHGRTRGTNKGFNQQRSSSSGWSFVRSLSQAFGNTVGHTVGNALTVGSTETAGTSQSVSESEAQTESQSRSAGENWSQSTTDKVVHLPRHREEFYDYGLKTPPESQLMRIAQLLSSLPVGFFLIRVHNQPTRLAKAFHIQPPSPQYLEHRKRLWNQPVFFDAKESQKWVEPLSPRETKKSSKKPKPRRNARSS